MDSPAYLPPVGASFLWPMPVASHTVHVHCIVDGAGLLQRSTVTGGERVDKGVAGQVHGFANSPDVAGVHVRGKSAVVLDEVNAPVGVELVEAVDVGLASRVAEIGAIPCGEQ